MTWQLIKDKIDKGFILGPFKEKPIEGLLCVPINIVEKETSSGLFHLMQDFSYPWGDSENGINALVPDKNKKVHYSGIDDVACMAIELGSPSYAMRIDIKHAFKLLPTVTRAVVPHQIQIPGSIFHPNSDPFWSFSILSPF